MRAHPLTADHRDGFSLIELTICLFLILVLAAMSLPALRTAMDRALLRHAAASTEQLISEALVQASASGAPTTLALSGIGENQLYWRLHTKGASPGRTQPLPIGVNALSARFGSELAAAEAVAAPGDDPNIATVTFYPSGVASPGALLLEAGAHRCRIVQPLRGAAHVEWLN